MHSVVIVEPKLTADPRKNVLFVVQMHILQESLDIFEVIVNNSNFINVSIILFLNKKDLLEEKIEKGVDISKYFSDFEGDPSVLEDVQRYLVFR